MELKSLVYKQYKYQVYLSKSNSYLSRVSIGYLEFQSSLVGIPGDIYLLLDSRMDILLHMSDRLQHPQRFHCLGKSHKSHHI